MPDYINRHLLTLDRVLPRARRHGPIYNNVAMNGFLGAFSKFKKKKIISFVMSVRLHVTTRLPLDGFSWNVMCFSQICPENSNFSEL